jgi:hypothetical protein
MLSFFLTRDKMAEEQQPLLHSPRELARREIEDIALRAFADVFTYHFVPIDPRAAILRRRKADDAMALTRREMDAARGKIVRILQTRSSDRSLDCDVLIDHAISALATMVSMTSSGDSAYIRSCKDTAAAYVMNALLLPLRAAPDIY